MEIINKYTPHAPRHAGLLISRCGKMPANKLIGVGNYQSQSQTMRCHVSFQNTPFLALHSPPTRREKFFDKRITTADIWIWILSIVLYNDMDKPPPGNLHEGSRRHNC
ncbi:predicted protein [Histoplasma capsulatum var. duboisii H88]|uniref:Predicted protein n=1 Tax=Ajellomyces capsulatus (strain H88) TaxID=544711 RepID=F0UU33_AJEC8|nr:predicted protein [Histoplasma capsulatum var. duboisii H88]